MTLYTRDFETVKRNIHMGGVKTIDYVFVCSLTKFGFYYKMVLQD
jgi:hypothetical protein